MRILFTLISVLTCTLVLAQRITQTHVPLSLRQVVEKIDPSEAVHLYLKGNFDELETKVNELGGVVKYSFREYLSVSIPASSVMELDAFEYLDYIHFEMGQGLPLLSSSRNHVRIDPVHNGQAGLPEAYQGEGVIMGVIDAGIELQHPDFQYPNGSTRIIELWDQTMQFNLQRTPSYGYGQVWDSVAINDSLCPHVDQASWFGHGTNTAGIAAGDGSSYPGYRGIAPESELIVVSSNFNAVGWTNTVADAVDYIFSRAEALGKPCVINASIGTYLGSHDGRDPAALSIAENITDSPARALVCAAGNSGDQDPYHLGYEAGQDTNFTWFELPNAAQIGSGLIFFEVYGDVGDMDRLQFSVGADQIAPSYKFRGSTAFDSVLNRINVIYQDSLFSSSGAYLGTVETFADSAEGTYRLQVLIYDVDSVDYHYRWSVTGQGRFDVWSANWLGLTDMVFDNLPAATAFPDIADYHVPDIKQSIVSSWTCSDKVITVGNFTNRTSYVDVDNQSVFLSGTTGDIASNSSFGPARTGVRKPDVSAPGDNTLTAGAFFQLDNLLSNPGTRHRVGVGGMHHRAGGTSSASPVVAGIAALFFEKCPGMNWNDLQQALTASTFEEDQYTGALPNDRWGYGKVDALETVRWSTPEVHLIYPSSEFCDGDTLQVSLSSSFPTMEWSTGALGSSIELTASESVHAEVVDDHGCLAVTDTLNAVLRPNPDQPTISAYDPIPFCPGHESYLSVDETFGSYAWNTGSFTNTILVNSPGDFICTVSNAYECSAVSDTFRLTYFPAMTAPSLHLVEGGQLRLIVDPSVAIETFWYLNETELEVTDPFSIANPSTGIYRAGYIDSNGCEHWTESINVYALGSGPMIEQDVRVFPNPFNEKLNLQGHPGLTNMMLIDALGRMVMQHELNQEMMTFSTKDVPPGAYILQLQTEEGRRINQRLIK